MRVVSYNVHRGGDDRMALLRVLRTLAPDVLCVQEAPSWWGAREKRELFATQTGLRYVAASARNAVFVADQISVLACLRKRIRRPYVRRRRSLFATQLPGGALLVTARRAGDDRAYTIGICHLGLATHARVGEVAQVLGLGAADLLVGDVNDASGGEVWSAVTAAGMRVLAAENPRPTFPAIDPVADIDLAAVGPDIDAELVDYDAIKGLRITDLTSASDHLPLIVDLGKQTVPAARRATRTGWPTAAPAGRRRS